MNGYTKGRLSPLHHHVLELLIQSVALGLGVGGIAVISLALNAGEAGIRWGGFLVGSLSMLVAVGIWKQCPKWMKERWPPRCPECGSIMDTACMVWQEPDFDNSPHYYTEYRCRNCPMKHTNDFFGKLIYGWPPKAAYAPEKRQPMTLADMLKTLIALLVMVGIIALL